MKTRTYLSVILAVAVIGVILAFFYLFPSPNPIDEGAVYTPAPASPVASAPPHPATSAPGASAAMVPPVPPPSAIPAPVPVAPPAKPSVLLDDAIRLPRPVTNQTPNLSPAGGK